MSKLRPDASGKRQLKIDEFAGIRHAFLYGPITSYREPSALFKRDGCYDEAFGVEGKLEDLWDEETVAQALCAIALTKKIQRIAKKDVEAVEKERRKTDPDFNLAEARYLYRLARYVSALVGVGLQAIMPSHLSNFRALMSSEVEFDRYTDPLIDRARDLVADEMAQRVQAKQLRAEYNFARDGDKWTVLKNRIQGDALTRVKFK